MRAFIALDIPEEIKKEIVKIQKEIDSLGLIKGKFTEQENLHLTLKFLGEIKENEINEIKEKLKKIKFWPFEAHLGNLGVFSEDFIRIIWVELKGEGVFEMQKKVDEMLKDIFPPEIQFMSHITLARPKYVEDKKTLIDELKKIKFEKKGFLAEGIALKKSELTPNGAKYSDLLVIENSDRYMTINSEFSKG